MQTGRTHSHNAPRDAQLRHAVYVEACGAGRGDDRAAFFERGDGAVIVVADGAGGSGGGATAADLVVRQTRKRASRLGTPRSLETFVRELDRAIERDPHAGETTAIILVIGDGTVAGASVGDSQAWLVDSEGALVLTGEQIRKPLVGSGEARPTAFSAPLAGRTLVAGSDGLFDYAKRDAIVQVAAGSLDAAGPSLAQCARLRSGALPDDLSVVVVRSNRRRLLYVENDPVFAAVVTEQFLSGYEVHRVASVAAASSALETGRYDAVLCDYDLDDGKGDAVVRKARALGFAAAIVAVSSHDEGNAALLRAGASSVCPKLAFETIAEHLAPRR